MAYKAAVIDHLSLRKMFRPSARLTAPGPSVLVRLRIYRAAAQLRERGSAALGLRVSDTESAVDVDASLQVPGRVGRPDAPESRGLVAPDGAC